MKSIGIGRKFLLAFSAIALVGSLFLASCSKEDGIDNDQDTYNTTGTASGNQQVPPVSSTGTATLTGNYNATTNVWNYNVNWSGLAAGATVIEVRGPADAGVNGDLVFTVTISGGGVSGTSNNSVTLSASQEASLLADDLYFTVLNATHVTGEVRGQIDANQVN